MKLIEMPEAVQIVAANFLAKKLDECVLWEHENRAEKAKEIASSVRKAFEELSS